MGFDTNLVQSQPVDPELICAICMGIFNDPMVICDQGHSCCRKCINDWKKRQSICPLCKGALGNFVLNRVVANMIKRALRQL